MGWATHLVETLRCGRLGATWGASEARQTTWRAPYKDQYRDTRTRHHAAHVHAMEPPQAHQPNPGESVATPQRLRTGNGTAESDTERAAPHNAKALGAGSPRLIGPSPARKGQVR